MAVKKELIGGNFYITYPTDYVFGRERNYIILEEYGEQVYINSIQFIKSTGETKTINLGGYDLLKNKKFIFDATAYYQWGFDEIGYNYTDMDGSVFADRMQVGGYSFLDCYSPFKEITGTICNETGMAMITPPNRMLKGDNDVKSLFCAKRASGSSVISVRWNINGVDDGSVMIRKNVSISNGGPFVAKYIQRINAQSLDVTLSTITRSAEVRDITRDVVYVTWRTRWGLDVSHVFYLDTYATDKDNAQEVESEYLYKEHSKHVIKGSFYLDNIRDPYDLWYYQTLANSELVVLTFDRCGTLPNTYMPNGTNALNGVKITGCNIKDAVVDGVAQSTITFDFELR